MSIEYLAGRMSRQLVTESHARDINKRPKLNAGRKQAGKEYMQSEHEYVMIRGGESTGITRTLLGRDARLQNQVNVLKFGSGEHKTLIQWILKKNVHPRKKK